MLVVAVGRLAFAGPLHEAVHVAAVIGELDEPIRPGEHALVLLNPSLVGVLIPVELGAVILLVEGVAAGAQLVELAGRSVDAGAHRFRGEPRLEVVLLVGVGHLLEVGDRDDGAGDAGHRGERILDRLLGFRLDRVDPGTHHLGEQLARRAVGREGEGVGVVDGEQPLDLVVPQLQSVAGGEVGTENAALGEVDVEAGAAGSLLLGDRLEVAPCVAGVEVVGVDNRGAEGHRHLLGRRQVVPVADHARRPRAGGGGAVVPVDEVDDADLDQRVLPDAFRERLVGVGPGVLVQAEPLDGGSAGDEEAESVLGEAGDDELPRPFGAVDRAALRLPTDAEGRVRHDAGEAQIGGDLGEGGAELHAVAADAVDEVAVALSMARVQIPAESGVGGHRHEEVAGGALRVERRLAAGRELGGEATGQPRGSLVLLGPDLEGVACGDSSIEELLNVVVREAGTLVLDVVVVHDWWVKMKAPPEPPGGACHERERWCSRN